MSHAVTSAKSKLLDIIQQQVVNLEAEKNLEAKAKGKKGFSFRSRLFSPQACLRLMMNMQSFTIFKEIVESDLFPLDKIPSVSAYVQRRDSIPLNTFSDLFDCYTDEVYWQCNRPDWTFLACDGSDIRYMPNPKDKDCYIKKHRRMKLPV